jgi:Winged helix-turn-helix DNA-binding
MSLPDQVHKLEQQVVDRLKELEPLTREYEQLRKVARRLGLKYSPGSAKRAATAKPAKTSERGRTRAGAVKRAARRPAKKRPGRAAARGSAAKPAATSRGTRSSTGQRAASRAEATGAKGKAAPSRAGKRAGQQSRGRRAAPARPGQRDDELLRLVGDNPGITVREIGERLGVDATGLYRVANRLIETGRVRKDGPRLYPVDTAAVPSPAPASGDTSEPPSTGASQTPGASAAAASGSSPTPADGSDAA